MIFLHTTLFPGASVLETLDEDQVAVCSVFDTDVDLAAIEIGVVKLVNAILSVLFGAHFYEAVTLGVSFGIIEESCSDGIKLVLLEEVHELLFVNLELEVAHVNYLCIVGLLGS